MATEIIKHSVRFVIAGIDIRDSEFPAVSYDNGVSDHPANWPGISRSAKVYDDYQTAYRRLINLYKELRNDDDSSLIRLGFTILGYKVTKTDIEYTDEERLAEILGQFNVPPGKM